MLFTRESYQQSRHFLKAHTYSQVDLMIYERNNDSSYKCLIPVGRSFSNFNHQIRHARDYFSPFLILPALVSSLHRAVVLAAQKKSSLPLNKKSAVRGGERRSVIER